MASSWNDPPSDDTQAAIAAFFAAESVKAGKWDRHLDQLGTAIRKRLIAIKLGRKYGGG